MTCPTTPFSTPSGFTMERVRSIAIAFYALFQRRLLAALRGAFRAAVLVFAPFFRPGAALTGFAARAGLPGRDVFAPATLFLAARAALIASPSWCGPSTTT